MYLRFIIHERKRLRSIRKGLFVASLRYKDSPLLSEEQREDVFSTLLWFSNKLPIPDDSVFPGGAGRCWFKEEAAACIDRMWRLSLLLSAAGARISQVYNRNPGRVTYQDDFQIVAVDRFSFQS